MHSTIILGLNAVWQKNCHLDTLRPGEVMRVLRQTCFASGKGANVAMALHVLKHSPVQLLECLGGNAGQKIRLDLERFRFSQEVIEIQSENRCCTTLLESSGRVSELIEPSPELSKEEWQSVALRLQRLLASRECTLLVTGSLPLGPDEPLWECLASRPKNQKLWVDSVDPRWLALGPEMVKINAHEACQLAQKLDLVSAGKHLKEQFGLANLVITNQSDNGWASCEGQEFTYAVPRVNMVRNSTGAGDSFFAGLYYAQGLRHSWSSALAFAAYFAATRCQFERIEDISFQPGGPFEQYLSR